MKIQICLLEKTIYLTYFGYSIRNKKILNNINFTKAQKRITHIFFLKKKTKRKINHLHIHMRNTNFLFQITSFQKTKNDQNYFQEKQTLVLVIFDSINDNINNCLEVAEDKG